MFPEEKTRRLSTPPSTGRLSESSELSPDGTYSLTATATDVADNTSTASSALRVTIDTQTPRLLHVFTPPSVTPIPVKQHSGCCHGCCYKGGFKGFGGRGSGDGGGKANPS